jgi:hypothetical protein
MTKSILIHIGLHKTGTTAIQQTLAEARTAGQLGSVCYPLPHLRSHNRLAAAYLPHHRLPRFDRTHFPIDNQSFRTDIAKLLRDCLAELGSVDSAVLSGENLSMLETPEIEKLRQDLRSSGYERFRVLVYVREPASQYLSESQQVRKASSQLLSPVCYRYEFRSVVESWGSVFPGELQIREFRSQHHAFDVVSDFASVLNDFHNVSLWLPSYARSNESVSAEGMLILQQYQSMFSWDQDDVFTMDKLALVRLLEESVSVVAQTPPVIRPEIAAVIRSRHREDVRWLASHHHVSLDLTQDYLQEAVVGIGSGRVSDVREVLQHCNPETAERLLYWIIHRAMSR